MSTVAETATLVHGYTMADVARAARVAVSKHSRSRSLDYSDRAECAWHAVVVELYTRTDPPAFPDLISAALNALDRETADFIRHHHGRTIEGTMAPKFQMYWLPVRTPPTDGFSDRVIEALALPRALSVLTDEQYEAIATLAAYDNVAGDAANAIGMKYHGFMYRVYSARVKVKEVWFEEETPVQSKPTGSTCRVGHSRAEFGIQLPDGRWECRVCKRASNRRHSARRAA